MVLCSHLLRLSRRKWHHTLHGLLQLLSGARILPLSQTLSILSLPCGGFLTLFSRRERGWRGLAKQGGQHREPILRWRSLIVSGVHHLHRKHGQKVDRRCFGAGLLRAGHGTVIIFIIATLNFSVVFSCVDQPSYVSRLTDNIVLLILSRLLGGRHRNSLGQIRLRLKSRVWFLAYLIMTGACRLQKEEAGLARSPLLARCQRCSGIA